MSLFYFLQKKILLNHYKKQPIMKHESIVSIAEAKMPKLGAKKGDPSLQDIYNDVVGVFDISAITMSGSLRKRHIAIPRQIFCYLAKMIKANTLKEIGTYIGNRHYSTVINCIVEVKDMIETNDDEFMGYWNKYKRNSKLWKEYFSLLNIKK